MAERGGERGVEAGGDRGGFGRGFGGGRGDRGDRGRGGRRGGRGGRRGRATEEEKWVPVTKLGRLVLAGHIKQIEHIYLHSLPVKEYQIIDLLIGPSLKDEVMKIMPVQKQTRAGQRTRFKAFVVVGDGNGHVGLGVKCSKEVATAIRGAIILAKLSVVPVRRGYWGNKIGKPHTVPCKVTGKCGSVTVRMVPAPRGAGIVAARVPKKVLQFAGIDDVFTSSRGSTKTLGNFVKVFCLDHRSYMKHTCPKGDREDVTVVICPLCAKGVRLNPNEDPNITWEKHVNTDCDPSNYEKATKKKKCPVPRCKEQLTFSNTIKCRDCNIDHCLKHRFGPDHTCPGPRKLPFMGFLSSSGSSSSSRKEAKTTRPNKAPASTSSSSSRWSNLLSSAEAGISRLGNDISQKLQFASSGNDGLVEVCPQCGAKFSSVTTLVEHVEKTHERNRKQNHGKVTVDVCPKCSRGFRDPVDLVNHIERDHRGTSKA